MSKRLSRKEIKEDIRHDELSTVLETTIQRFQENRNLILGSVAAVLLAGLAAIATTSWLDSRNEAAQKELAEVVRAADAPVGEEAASPLALTFASEEERKEALKSRLQDVGGGPGKGDLAKIASLYEADLALQEGDEETARRLWEEFLDAHEDHVVAASVRLNLIRLDREEGRAEEVLNLLQAELDRAKRDLPEDVVLFELAETLRSLGRMDEAKERYQQLLDEHPESPWTGDARRFVAES